MADMAGMKISDTAQCVSESAASAERLSGSGEVADGREGRGEAAGSRGTTAKSRQSSKVMLSKRLQMLADMVTPGNRLVDVGCDHGYLSIRLVCAGICPGAIAMDVREGPLAAAKAHIAEARLEDYIEVRLSDGLAECGQGEADTLVCAGMGGRLMERILRDGLEKARSMRELILQPQSELPQFRAFLRENGFAVVDENAVFEEGKYYFAMKAVYRPETGRIREHRAPGEDSEADAEASANGGNGSGKRNPDAAEEREERQRLYELYGGLLLQKKHPVLLQYLRQREDYIGMLERSLAFAGTRKAERRVGALRCELEDIRAALAVYSGGAMT